MFDAVHHVQLAMPRGGEATARVFFAGVLGMTEVAKPPVLAAQLAGRHHPLEPQCGRSTPPRTPATTIRWIP
ncbi:MAG TPA: hypothetical protein VFO16_22915 [Pseudonocardiaceae bacterium]|nr:hypothetical protein [Pseudonocardiaceae bacterium]